MDKSIVKLRKRYYTNYKMSYEHQRDFIREVEGNNSCEIDGNYQMKKM